MALKSTTKLLVRFNNNSLTDEVSGETCSVVGSGSAAINADGSGYQMNRSQYLLKKNIDLNLSTTFYLSFDFVPTNEGRIQNGVTNDPVNISVLDFGVGSGSGSDFVMSRNVAVVQEECDEDNTTNKMKIQIYNVAGTLSYTATTTSYDVGKKHNVVWVYDGGSGLSCFLDGVEITGSLTTSGSLPASISTTTAALTVNRYAESDGDLINSVGSIDNIFLSTDTTFSSEDVAAMSRNGIKYLAFDDFDTMTELDFGLFFNDPSPVRVNASAQDGGSILIARTDGVLAEGSRQFWQSRRNFSDEKEIDALTAKGNVVEQEKRLLKLDEMIEL